ncbi:RNA methyltransferase [Sulfurimonas lithotrophica]|uniref:RNA methyltransferase n=1 Tax=Sulfurimonas lithotrophica TaxID=2590022 RepID=A0A5P8P372_9BACT|nr:RNA methyltransferase [Sulfurimonas lithotrophica]QFR50061.1 RNA methyltransferase [Sulfurimonas lithotrophica]
MKDSQEYKNKKKFFDSVITLYGRNVVVEVLEDMNVEIHRLHMSESNQIDGAIKKINALAKTRGIEILIHDKKSLSRISKNSKQDQGVAIDIVTKTYKSADDIKDMKNYKLIALDGIQNPQNLGMIIRSCAAGFIDGIILPKKSSAKISPLVMKASAGTLFKLPIYYCNSLEDVFDGLDADIYTLSSHAQNSIYDIKLSKKSIFVLGNESEGVSKKVNELCTKSISIPMQRGVESLNVAVTASLIAFIKF